MYTDKVIFTKIKTLGPEEHRSPWQRVGQELAGVDQQAVSLRHLQRDEEELPQANAVSSVSVCNQPLRGI